MVETTSGGSAPTVSVTDRIAAVFSAPIPFFPALFSVLAVALVFIWRAMEWRYGGVIALTRTMLQLAEREAQSAKQKESELSDTIKKLISEIDDLKKAPVGSDLQPRITNLANTTTTANSQLVELRKTNSAVSDFLRRGATANATVQGLPAYLIPFNDDRWLKGGQ